MAITQVRALINGQWHTLTYNEATRRYEASLTLTGTSFHEPGGYFNVTVEATNDTGTTVTTDGGNIPGLRLTLRETDKPVLTLISPPEGYVTTKTPLITLTAMDGAAGSGVDTSTLSVLADGAAVAAEAIGITGGYQIMATPPALSEGRHTVTVAVSDYDGNEAALSLAYIVDTVPPVLTAQATDMRTVVDVDSTVISGYTNDVTAPPVTVSVTRGGADMGTVFIGPDGKFDHPVPLEIGLNEIAVTATDGAGLSTTLIVPVIRLITDRTEKDIAKVSALLEKGLANWTAEEAAWFRRHILRGSYDYTDFNRVNTAMAYLSDKFGRVGYLTPYRPNGPWAKEDAAQPGTTQAYLDNVRRMRAVLTLPEYAPNVPADMAGFLWWEANNIEIILVELDAALKLPWRQAWGSGEIGCGEV